ncbi:dihydrofolate reductase [Neobittarella massiliensis]|uniref:Dihydrofolate reductase n=1 Tax=Neobittarella massiliensis (ex Bilen et al. 2018) TaxID=2041842 RepID=A0A8J6M235_9FIRM|nr:dihydrofolate reductase family protein [Neobittarella massiliensis]MBC3517066.1 dihydrofolate reductase [Neobittarella massiliensis]
MRRVVVYIGMSLDGYIADRNGGVKWMTGDSSEPGSAGSYQQFIDSVDTVLMGYRTYHQIVTELSGGSWVYRGKKSYVLTHRDMESTGEITFTHQDLIALVGALKARPGGDIWVCGGADIICQLMAGQLIDRYHVTVLPVILGGGLRLFAPQERCCRLRLLSTAVYDGMVDLVYERR